MGYTCKSFKNTGYSVFKGRNINTCQKIGIMTSKKRGTDMCIGWLIILSNNNNNNNNKNTNTNNNNVPGNNKKAGHSNQI